MSTILQVEEFLVGLQGRIVSALEQVDGKSFHRDQWKRQEGGGGVSCVLEQGNVFERGGGELLPCFWRRTPGIGHCSTTRIIRTIVRGNGCITGITST